MISFKGGHYLSGKLTLEKDARERLGIATA